MTAKRLAAAWICLGLGGCAFEPALTRQLVDYNRAYEDSTNSVLLLNVLRAKDRKPLHFTTLTQLSPSISGSGNIGFTIPLNPIAYTTLGITTGGSVSTGNSGTVAIENTQEFVRGFMKPVDMETFEYFWSQGWSREMLLLLLVRRIEILPTDQNGVALPGRRVKVFENAPRALDANKACGPPPPDRVPAEAWCRFREFQDFVNILEERIRFARAVDVVPVTPKMSGEKAEEMKLLVDAAKANLEIVYDEKDKKFQVVRRSSSVTLCLADQAKEGDEDGWRRATQFRCNVVASGAKTAPGVPTSAERRALEGAKAGRFEAVIGGASRISLKDLSPDPEKRKRQSKFNDNIAACVDGRCAIVLYMRSPEAMVYYLGEILRTAEQSQRRQVVLAFEEGRAELFDVRRGPPGPDGNHLSVQYDGNIYHVPQSRGNRAMHALSLVSQLAGLQRKASELPRTTTLTIVRQ